MGSVRSASSDRAQRGSTIACSPEARPKRSRMPEERECERQLYRAPRDREMGGERQYRHQSVHRQRAGQRTIVAEPTYNRP